MCPIDTVRIGTRCTEKAHGKQQFGVRKNDSRYRIQVTGDFPCNQGMYCLC